MIFTIIVYVCMRVSVHERERESVCREKERAEREREKGKREMGVQMTVFLHNMLCHKTPSNNSLVSALL